MPPVSRATLNRIGAVPTGNYRYAGKIWWHLRWPTMVLGTPRPGALKLTKHSLCAKPLMGEQQGMEDPADPILVCGRCLEAAQSFRALHPR